ncbi:hypothetical protein [Chroococcidiopsis thermalis]|uniref:Uncharacterized protein n=1 Tax=Chroococcidiopsis thermalis (strain PCC 7203) TaxID=251229 RepID=K9U929_CHRTP|nr:hypothetical protein [Chroococcidiopsis thermalis]AFY91123.1 hypothetical protein Chro_5783 [Chroococcidiopsis thermalis PCC 7203]
MLQNFLTIVIELTIVAFAIFMAIDFTTRVTELFESIFQQSTAPGIQQQLVQSSSQKIAIAPKLLPQQGLNMLEDPWISDSTSTATSTTRAIATSLPVPQMRLLPPARQSLTEEFDITVLKLYKLHGYSVVRVTDLPIKVPASLKRYKLHKRDVVRSIDLEKLLAT